MKEAKTEDMELGNLLFGNSRGQYAIANNIAAVVWQSDDDDRFEDFKRVRAYVHVVADHADKG